jgi:hypothetical protein
MERLGQVPKVTVERFTDEVDQDARPAGAPCARARRHEYQKEALCRFRGNNRGRLAD